MPTSPPIPLALMDFLPPVAFAMGAFFLVKLARLQEQTVSARMLTIGGVLIFSAGALKPPRNYCSHCTLPRFPFL